MEVVKPSENPDEVVAVNVGKKINAEVMKGSIGNMKVVREFVRIRERPPPPENVSYSEIEETVLLIMWDPPAFYEMFSIKYYLVYYRKYGDVIWRNISSYSSSRNVRIANLESNSNYNAYVTAVNDEGESKKSAAVNVKTFQVKETVLSKWTYLVPIVILIISVILVVIILLYRRLRSTQGFQVAMPQIVSKRGDECSSHREDVNFGFFGETAGTDERSTSRLADSRYITQSEINREITELANDGAEQHEMEEVARKDGKGENAFQNVNV